MFLLILAVRIWTPLPPWLENEQIHTHAHTRTHVQTHTDTYTHIHTHIHTLRDIHARTLERLACQVIRSFVLRTGCPAFSRPRLNRHKSRPIRGWVIRRPHSARSAADSAPCWPIHGKKGGPKVQRGMDTVPDQNEGFGRTGNYT